MILKTDCKFFPGDRPCKPNKTMGIMCDDCNYYQPVKFKILIIKLDAVGDVLRTTSILSSLKEKYPQSHITWLTKSNAKELFDNNEYIDELFLWESNTTLPYLQSASFDLLFHPDASPVSSSLASIVNAKEKKGYILNTLGKVEPVNNDAVEWLEMGAFDQYKKRNSKTYQQIIHEIAGLPYNKSEIVLRLSEEEIKFAEDFSAKNNLNRFKILIGLNTGASKRWQLKQWRLQGYEELIEKLTADTEIGILLYGGKEEAERNEHLANKYNSIINTGSENTLRQFFALMNLCNIVVTGDTLALHAATALKKRVVCLFGPTSSAEIEDYGRITKIYPEMECLVCYKPECDFNPNCMDLITTQTVYKAVKNEIISIRKKTE